MIFSGAKPLANPRGLSSPFFTLPMEEATFATLASFSLPLAVDFRLLTAALAAEVFLASRS